MARVLRILAKAAEAASAAAFAAMFLLFLAGVFARYVLGKPLVWSDELIMMIFLWVVFLTEAFVITEREQVTFDGIYDLVGERCRRDHPVRGALMVGVMFLIALPTVFDYVRFLWRERTNALQWRLDFVYFCFVVFWVAVIVRAAIQARAACLPNWRNEVASRAPTSAPTCWAKPCRCIGDPDPADVRSVHRVRDAALLDRADDVRLRPRLSVGEQAGHRPDRRPDAQFELPAQRAAGDPDVHPRRQRDERRDHLGAIWAAADAVIGRLRAGLGHVTVLMNVVISSACREAP